MSTLVIARGLSLAGRLQRTDLDLTAGKLTCLIGPNGSGKTSLLHALAGIGAPSGQVVIRGIDPAREPPSRRGTLLSYLSASRDIAWPLVARDLVGLGLPDGVPSSRIEEMLALFELDGLADRRVDHLSTGERSRLLIARALAADANLLLLDEPTANLDLSHQATLLTLVRNRCDEHDAAALVITHDINLAAQFADHILLLKSGRVVEAGPPRAVLTPELLREVFAVTVLVDAHPVTNAPRVTPVHGGK